MKIPQIRPPTVWIYFNTAYVACLGSSSTIKCCFRNLSKFYVFTSRQAVFVCGINKAPSPWGQGYAIPPTCML